MVTLNIEGTMYLNTAVKVPVMKGKIITKKDGTTHILYQYGSEYNREKQYSVPLRAIVGKVTPSDPTMMFPNEKIQVYFPDAEIPEELPFAYRSCCLKIGSCVIIRKVLEEYRLVPMLRKRFENDTGLILDLVSCLIVEEENVGQYSPDFEFSKAKDDNGLPVLNLSIAMDKTNRVPLFYEKYPGSITDVSQSTFMVDKVKEYEYKKIGFILDRGYFSKENIRYIDDNDYSFIIMCKGYKTLVSSLVLENCGKF